MKHPLGQFAPLSKWAHYYSIDRRTLRKRLELDPTVRGMFPTGVKNPLVERCYIERVMERYSMRPGWTSDRKRTDGT